MAPRFNKNRSAVIVDACTSVPVDLRNADYAALIASGTVIEDHVEPSLTQADFDAAITQHINAVARSADFIDANDAAGFVTSTKPDWAAQAQAFVAWRDAVWIAFDAAKSNLPATVAEFIASLPVIQRPAAAT